MTHYTSMVFFNNDRFGVDDAARVLTDRGLSVARRGVRRLAVWWGPDQGPELGVVLVRRDHVQAEAAEIADGTPHAESMSRCNARFEIEINDLNEVLDEINTLIEVQITLQDATNGFLYNSWNGKLSAPGE